MAKDFTAQERAALYALFSIDEHEIREGSTSKDKKKIQFFTYVRREAIQARLDELFFGEWELYFLDATKPAIYFDKHVDCSMGLSIRGVRREYNGSQDGGGLNGAKGAATDAFKRVASMWGIGLYLQNSPAIWVENYVTYEGDKKVSTDWKKKDKVEESAMLQVEKWLRQIGASGQGIFPANEENPVKEEKQADIPDALNPDTHFGEKPDNWLILLKELTFPFYGVEKHQDASIKHHLEDTGIINREMTADTAAAYLFNHRMAKDFGFGSTEIKAAFGSQFGDWLKKNPRNYAKAWEIAQNHHHQLENMPE